MRQEIPVVVLGPDGRPAAGASVYVRTSPGGADATIYQARTGAATHGNPRTSDAQGRVTGWLERGEYAATNTVPGLDPWVEEFPITPAVDGGIDALWLPDGFVVPVGTVVDFAGAADVGNWLLCDGRALDRVAYAALFAALGGASSPWGLPLPATFSIPDLRGRVTVGKGTHAEVDALNDNDGLAVGSRKLKHRHGKGTLATGNDTPDHTHASAVGATAPFTYYASATVTSAFVTAITNTSTGGANTRHTHPLTGEAGDTAGPLDGPAYAVTNKLIRAR
jgi:microcystin-dependent protein